MVIISILIIFSSCVRYIDSRKELQERYDLKDNDPARERTGMKGFFRYEQEQRKRLEKLVEERQAELANNPNSEYLIGIGDKIQVSVRNFDELSKDYTVGTDGKIRIPFIGTLKVNGLSEEQAAAKVEELVSDYVVEPQVDLEVISYASNVIWMINSSYASQREVYGGGESGYRTAFPLKRPGMTLVELLLEAGDSNIFERGVVYLYPATPDIITEKNFDLEKRFVDFGTGNWSLGKDFDPKDCTGQEFTPESAKFRVKACYPFENNISPEDIRAKYEVGARIEIDIEELMGGATGAPLPIILKAGDIIKVPPPPIIQVFGEVNRRGTFQVQSGGTGNVGSGSNGIKPTLLSVLSEARGLTFSADIHEILIYREIQFGNKAILSLDLEKVVLVAGQDVKLRDGDIVYIPSKANRYKEEQSVNAINRITGAIINLDNAVGVDAKGGI